MSKNSLRFGGSPARAIDLCCPGSGAIRAGRAYADLFGTLRAGFLYGPAATERTWGRKSATAGIWAYRAAAAAFCMGASRLSRQRAFVSAASAGVPRPAPPRGPARLWKYGRAECRRPHVCAAGGPETIRGSPAEASQPVGAACGAPNARAAAQASMATRRPQRRTLSCRPARRG